MLQVRLCRTPRRESIPTPSPVGAGLGACLKSRPTPQFSLLCGLNSCLRHPSHWSRIANRAVFYGLMRQAPPTSPPSLPPSIPAHITPPFRALTPCHSEAPRGILCDATVIELGCPGAAGRRNRGPSRPSFSMCRRTLSHLSPYSCPGQTTRTCKEGIT